MSLLKKVLNRPFFIRLFNWEYWSFAAVYIPVVPVWFYYCLRARSFFFFSASNPTIENGGFLMESKKKIYDLIPAAFYPKTILVTLPADPDEVMARIHASGLQYPLIAKPDIGARGMGVRKLRNAADLRAYCQESPLEFLVQEYADLPLEAGIFYCRLPGEKKGRITGIVSKEFLTVIGDGIHTIRELCQQEKRFILQLDALQKMHGDALDKVIAKGERKELVPYGNHARGAKFIDDTFRASEALQQQIDLILQQVDRFYYGRMDIRFRTWEELEEGSAFSIIELNGAGSEPTHMYDPRHSIFFAWKEIIRHWDWCYRISLLNHKKGIPYMSFAEGVKMFRDNAQFEKTIAQLYV
ncbi:hypothetical protein [Flavihumibacter sp. UBA7668]|uniref:hypothetical protein n=1 Tax=Flavihumibacter sp. UBA7668 TaxID=1946542 RepID=UPI0025C5E9A7|nr:hypothetical protein [Flavihumibacter sp. UBA7668]